MTEPPRAARGTYPGPMPPEISPAQRRRRTLLRVAVIVGAILCLLLLNLVVVAMKLEKPFDLFIPLGFGALIGLGVIAAWGEIR